MPVTDQVQERPGAEPATLSPRPADGGLSWGERLVRDAGQVLRDDVAAGGREERQLTLTRNAGLRHCTLAAGATAPAAMHRSVEEHWYFLGGSGQVWRREGERDVVVDVAPGLALAIPPRTPFQLRNTGPLPLSFLVAALPPSPGAQEAVRVPDFWPTP